MASNNALLQSAFLRTPKTKNKHKDQMELPIFNDVKCAKKLTIAVNDNLHLTRQANQITIDKGLFLAPNGNKINGAWVTRGAYQHDLFNYHYKRFLVYINRKRVSKAVKSTLNMVMANLINASNQQAQLIYSRDNTANNRLIIECIDYLSSSDLLVDVAGKNNEYQDNSSWVIPSDKFKLEVERSKIKIGLVKGYSKVILRDDKKKSIPISKDRNIQVKYKRLCLPVDAHNSLWLNHTASTEVGEIVPFAHRVYNRTLSLGGRFYSPCQNVTRAQRKTMIIDDEATAEPDFSSNHFVLLYAMVGLQLTPLEDKPYELDGFTRPVVKAAMLTFLNSTNLKVFTRNITRSGKPSVKSASAKYEYLLENHLLRSAQGLPTKRPKKYGYLKGITKGMPDNIDGEKLLSALKDKHKPIAHLFGKEDIGLELQNLDSEIMAAIISSTAALNIPILPVHDSVICKKSDLPIVIDLMEKAHVSVVKFKGFVAV